MRTIKGTCGFLGLPRLEALTHAAETSEDLAVVQAPGSKRTSCESTRSRPSAVSVKKSRNSSSIDATLPPNTELRLHPSRVVAASAQPALPPASGAPVALKGRGSLLAKHFNFSCAVGQSRPGKLTIAVNKRLRQPRWCYDIIGVSEILRLLSPAMPQKRPLVRSGAGRCLDPPDSERDAWARLLDGGPSAQAETSS